jgi:hypothetical protein
MPYTYFFIEEWHPILSGVIRVRLREINLPITRKPSILLWAV